LVTIICLCYNHEDYVQQSLESAWNQSYNNIELIIVNDLSKDHSLEKINNWLRNKNSDRIHFINNSTNLGHTKSFNKAYNIASGEFIIDLATDDLLTQNAVAQHMENFKHNQNSGVSFSNIENINADGEIINTFYKANENTPYFKDLIPKSGYLYNELLSAFYLNACGMCVKKEVYDYLGGYDETLDYEDFDFWVRSSFKYNYIYGDFISVKKRMLVTSHSVLAKTVRENQFRKDKSTYRVCQKAYTQNQTKQNFEALIVRGIHEFKIMVKTNNIGIAFKYGILILKSYCKKVTLQFVKS